MGSQDSLLEITFRSRPAAAPREPLTCSSSMGALLQANDGAWLPTSPPPCSPSTTSADLSLQPLGSSGVRLECFRFPSRAAAGPEPGQDPGETPSDEGSLLGEQVLGALELLRFRESGIGSEYESNTDESDDRDSWGPAEGAGADGAARLLNLLNAESLPDSLGDEVAV